jgi:radical SAM superfamily enzyme YgiQ (UPF0313 family)
MRVLLAHPPLNASSEVTPPLGLCTLAAWLHHQGHEVRILDLDLEIKDRPDGQALYLRLLTNALSDFSPGAVGITSMYNNSLQAERMMQAVKHYNPYITTIAGGSHFGALGCEALRRIPQLDFAIEGEGEQAFSQLLEALEAGTSVTGIPRLQHRVDGELRVNPAHGLLDLSELPPTWSTLGQSIDLERYARTIPNDADRRSIYIEAGRGCPFACTFCATAPFWERRYRVKPVAQIIAEMRFLYEEYGYNGFMLVHDLLTVDKKFINSFCDAMIESRLPVEWMANHRTDIDLHGLLPKMKTAGCWAMFFGVESASARLQKEMHKGLTRDGMVSTITALSDLGITSTCSFVIGFPDETAAEVSSSISLGAELKLIGAGMIQFHRLRTWPPAPLSRSELAAEFDVDSLRIEYPFLNVPPEDIDAIKADSSFFAGYFAPYSEAGTFAQLADVELFFTQAVAVAPLTIAVLGRVMGHSLIESFYSVVAHRGAITRADIEADTSSLLPIWSLLRPFMEAWVAEHQALEDWERELVRSVMAYEDHRLSFLNGGGYVVADDVVTGGENWQAFISKVDIAAVFEAMQKNEPLTATLLQEWAVVLVRNDLNSYRAYTTDVSRVGELSQHPMLVGSAARG